MFREAVRPAAAIAALGLVLSACAGASRGTPSASGTPYADWASNARVLIGQLRGDIAATSVTGQTTESAAHALRDESDLYALLVTYSDLGGCSAMVRSSGAAGGGAATALPLAHACGHLQRAAVLFTRATTAAAPGALLAASAEARRASPYLVQAALGLREAGAR